MKKMMDAYAEKQGKNVAQIRFLFDGHNINPTDTPEKVQHVVYCLLFIS